MGYLHSKNILCIFITWTFFEYFYNVSIFLKKEEIFLEKEKNSIFDSQKGSKNVHVIKARKGTSCHCKGTNR